MTLLLILSISVKKIHLYQVSVENSLLSFCTLKINLKTVDVIHGFLFPNGDIQTKLIL